MVEDAKMSDAGEDEKDKEKRDEETKKAETTEPAPAAAAPPPLESAARRLERLLSEQVLDFYTDPVKVVRRWLGTSSGAAGDAKAADISDAAAKLLDPAGPSAAGRSLLLLVATVEEGGGASTDAMDISEQAEEKTAEKTEVKPDYLEAASREVETWLISLAVRLLWREGRHTDAFELSQKGIEIVSRHLEEQALPAPSLFPLLARMFRLRSLVAESLHSPAVDVGLRAGMARAHNVATLRRDVDTQSTVLNCMLRDLLRHSQGECDYGGGPKSAGVFFFLLVSPYFAETAISHV